MGIFENSFAGGARHPDPGSRTDVAVSLCARRETHVRKTGLDLRHRALRSSDARPRLGGDSGAVAPGLGIAATVLRPASRTRTARGHGSGDKRRPGGRAPRSRRLEASVSWRCAAGSSCRVHALHVAIIGNSRSTMALPHRPLPDAFRSGIPCPAAPTLADLPVLPLPADPVALEICTRGSGLTQAA